MNDTPRTDALERANHKKDVYSSFFQMRDLAWNLERELAAARAEIERLDTVGIHSCHKDCQRPNCVLRRELKAVTEQRDELLRYNEEFRNETLICADCDAIRKEEYDRAIEQRDKEREIYQKSYSAELARSNHYKQQRDRLADLVKQFVSILDITEESDSGRLFHPTNITSCRAGDLQKIGELVEALRMASRTTNPNEL